MPSPVLKARIRDLSPEQFADSLVDQARAHVRRIGAMVAIGDKSPSPSCPLREMALELMRYARSGEQPSRPVKELIDEVTEVMLSRPIGGSGKATVNLNTITKDSLGQLVVVLRAAKARRTLEEGRPLSMPDVAALAGVTTVFARQELLAGGLKGKRVDSTWLIQPADARVWLRNRGVAGV